MINSIIEYCSLPVDRGFLFFWSIVIGLCWWVAEKIEKFKKG